MVYCDFRKIWSLAEGRQCPLPLASLHMAASSMEPQHGISKSAKSLIFPLFIEISRPLILCFKNVALGSRVLVLMTTLSWDSEVCFDHPWGIISASECENIFRHFAKQLLRRSLVEQIHRVGNKLWSASREYDSSRWLCMQVKTASISSESNPNQCNHPAENDSFSPRIEYWKAIFFTTSLVRLNSTKTQARLSNSLLYNLFSVLP